MKPNLKGKDDKNASQLKSNVGGNQQKVLKPPDQDSIYEEQDYGNMQDIATKGQNQKGNAVGGKGAVQDGDKPPKFVSEEEYKKQLDGVYQDAGRFKPVISQQQPQSSRQVTNNISKQPNQASNGMSDDQVNIMNKSEENLSFKRNLANKLNDKYKFTQNLNQQSIKVSEDEEEDKKKKIKDFHTIEEGNQIGRLHDIDTKFPQQTLRYGDIITVNFDKSISKLEGKFFFYRGIVYCNGVTKMNLDIMSRNFKDRPEAFCNFKCCLFRIESCSSYEINQRMNQLKQSRLQVEEDEELSEQKQMDRPEGKSKDHYKDKLKALQKKINQLQDDFDRENRDNNYLNDQIKGSKVLYGDMLLLRHVESGMFLSLDQNEAAEENGCGAAKLMPLNECSILSIVPSDRLRQNGQIILYQDSFLIQNYIEPTANKQAQYLHASIFKLEKKDPQKAAKSVLEVNGSSDTTSFKARLFQPYDFVGKMAEEQEENIFSGNVIKFYHKQTNGYLSVRMPEILSQPELQYPRKVEDEIKLFKEAEDKIKRICQQSQTTTDQGEEEKNQLMKQPTSKISTTVVPPLASLEKGPSSKYKSSHSVHQDHIQNELAKVQEVITVPEVTIEIDIQDSNKARYFWEIQKLKPFVTKQVSQEDFYRIKHVQTGLYLCLIDKSADDNAENLDLEEEKKEDGKEDIKTYEVSLKPLDDIENFLFKVLKDTKAEDKSEESEVKQQKENVKNLNLIIIQSLKGAKLQSIPKKQEEELMQKLEKNNSIFKTHDQLQQQNFESVKCMDDNRESHSRMVFTIQKAISTQATLVEVTLNQCDSSKYFFKKLNKFALRKSWDNNDLINDLQRAKEKEGDLEKYTKNFKKNLVDLRIHLKNLAEANPDEYRLFQNYLAEQGVLDVYVKLLELVILRTTPLDQRYIYSRNKRYFEQVNLKMKENKIEKMEELENYLPFLKQQKVVLEIKQKDATKTLESETKGKVKGGQLESEETECDIIQRNILLIPAEILSAILLMIKGNQMVDSILDKYPEILFNQLLGPNIKKAKKIFKVSYKLSRSRSNKGDYQSCQDAASKQISNQESLGRWIDLIFDPQYISEDNQNLKQQIIFLKVISLICQDENGDGIYQNQMLVYQKLLKGDNRIRTIYFGMSKENLDPYIQFSLKGEDEDEKNADQNFFFDQNVQLKYQMSQKDQTSKRTSDDTKTPPISLMKIFMSKEPALQGYSKYLCAYLDTVIACLQNGHKFGLTYPTDVGLTGLFALKVINDSKKVPKLNSILLKLLTYMFINNDPSYGNVGIKNRCYYWRNIEKGQMYHKYLQIPIKETQSKQEEQKQNEAFRTRKEEEQEKEKERKKEQFRELEKKQVYSLIPRFIEKFLKVDQSKAYDQIDNDQMTAQQTEEDDQEIKSNLTLIIASLQCSIELIQCEKSSPALTYKIIYAAAVIFSRFLYKKEQEKVQVDQENGEEEEEQKNNNFKKNSLFSLIKKARDKGSKFKELVEEVYTLLLKNLIAISKKRTDDQIMIALKSYKNSYDGDIQRALEFKLLNHGLKNQRQPQDNLASSLANLFSLEATGSTVIDPRFVDSITDDVQRLECQDLNNFFSGKADGESVKYNLKKELLFLIFDKKLKQSTKSLAFEVLMLNFEMVNSLLREMKKIYIITTEEQSEYQSMQEIRSKIVDLVSDIIWYSFGVVHQTKEKQTKTREDSKKVTDECCKEIKKLTDRLEGQDKKNRVQRQMMLRFLDMPKLLIDCIMKNVNYDAEMHQDFFKTIMEFLYYYSQKNEQNSQSLTAHLDYLSTLQETQISNEKLITQIVKQLKSQEKETQLIDHIFKQINQDNKEHTSTLLKSLNSLAQNSAFNKGNIFNKILKMKVFRYVCFSTKKNQSALEMNDPNKDPHQKIAVLVAAYSEVIDKWNKYAIENSDDPFINKNRYIKIQYTQIAKEEIVFRHEYIIHRRLISLLIQCCKDSTNTIPQIAKIAPMNKIQETLDKDTTPYLLKKKYLRLLHSVHFTFTDDQLNQIFLKDHKKILKLFQKVIYQDLMEFPYALQKQFIKFKDHLLADLKQKQTEKLMKEIKQRLVKYWQRNKQSQQIDEEEQFRQIQEQLRNKSDQNELFNEYDNLIHPPVSFALDNIPTRANQNPQNFPAIGQSLLTSSSGTTGKVFTPPAGGTFQSFRANGSYPTANIQGTISALDNLKVEDQDLEDIDNRIKQLINEISKWKDPRKNKKDKSNPSGTANPVDKKTLPKAQEAVDQNNFEQSFLKKFINQDDPSEYWRYLFYRSNTMNAKDGLLQFLIDFFSIVKDEVDQTLIDIFKEVFARLRTLADTLKYIAEKKNDMISNNDELVLKIEEAIKSVKNVLNENENSQKKKEGKLIPYGQPGSVKIIHNFNDMAPSLYKKEQKHPNQAGKKSILKAPSRLDHFPTPTYGAGEKTIDEAFGRSDVDPGYGIANNATAFHGQSILDANENKQLHELFLMDIADNQLGNYLDQKEDDSIIHELLRQFCIYMVNQGKGLPDLFGLPTTYGQSETVGRDKFVELIKIMQQEQRSHNQYDNSLGLKLFDNIKEQQNQNNQDEQEKAEEGMQADEESINLSQFKKQIEDFLIKDMELTDKQKQETRTQLDKGYTDKQQQLKGQRSNFKEFYKRIFESSNLNNEKDLISIIKVIVNTFEAQTKHEQHKDIMNFVSNMIQGLQMKNQRFYILKVLKGILEMYQEKSQSVENKNIEEMRTDIKQFHTFIQIMKECKLAEHLIRYLDSSENDAVALLSIRILIILLQGMNLKIQSQLFEFIREKQDELKVAEYLKSRIEYYTPIIIQQKFDMIKAITMAQVRDAKNSANKDESSQNVKVLEPYDITEKDTAILDLLKERTNTIQQFKSILRFIQLLCDNCHRGFQNFFRDQLTIQQNNAQQSQYQNQIIEETIENTSSFNIIVIVAKSFMKLTDTFKDLIFFDQIKKNLDNKGKSPEEIQAQKMAYEEDIQKEGDLSDLMATFIEVIIDFLYGPCEANQMLLSGWEMFLINVNFYFSSDNVYFFAHAYSQECRFNLMFKASLLLLGIVENPNSHVSKQILQNLRSGISLANLQKILIEIHKQKIYSIEGSYSIFKSRRRLQQPAPHLKNYPNQSLRPSDETIFEIGFNLFKFLYIAKRLLPYVSILRINDGNYRPDQEPELEKGYRDMIEKEESIDRLFRDKVLESSLNARLIKIQINNFVSQNNERIRQDHRTLYKVLKIWITEAQTRIAEDEAKKVAIERDGDISQSSSKSVSKKQKSGSKSKIMSEGLYDSKGETTNQLTLLMSKESMYEEKGSKDIFNEKQQGDFLKLIKKVIDKDDEKVTKFKRELEKHNVQQLKEFDDDQEEQEKSEGITMKKILSYQLNKAVQFYSEFIAEVEVDYKGTLVRSIFKIPQKCAYLSSKSREGLLYGQKTSSLYDKLEALFAQMPVIIAEMKSNQRLSRKSYLRYWISEYNVVFQTLSSIFIILVNIVYLLFYGYYQNNGEDLEFSLEQMHIVAEILAIAQAIISFFIHLGYIEKYHGAYHQIFLEQKRISTSNRYTKFKGSLGFAEGMSIIKEQRNIVETNMHNLREAFNRSKREQRKGLSRMKDVVYALKMYFIGFTLDPIHCFNLLYLVCSIGAIYYPLLFSVILLGNILQIPLLQTVIKAIVNNRRQILLTLLLLLVIVYVYAFIALIAFSNTYTTNDDGSALNNYCDNLGYCFTTTLNNGIRSGGGIGDALKPMDIEDKQYWGRYAFDLTFYIMIIVLLLNLIFGIIIDAFAAMRDMRNEVEREVMEKCFICGKASTLFESKKKSFQDHIQKEHNVYAYVYYIFYLSRKATTECTGVERYVQLMIAQEDPNFFPIDKALSLEEADQDEIYDPEQNEHHHQQS